MPPLPISFTSAIHDLEDILTDVGSALAVLMIAIEGVRWTAAQSPQDRESAKKGIIYIVAGLGLLVSSENLVSYLLS